MEISLETLRGPDQCAVPKGVVFVSFWSENGYEVFSLTGGQPLCKFIGTNESVCIRDFHSARICLGHQHGRGFIVLGHQYGRCDVM